MRSPGITLHLHPPLGLLLAAALVSACDPQTDNDRDGFFAPGKDCDDADPTVSPSAVEVCDGIDNDCDGEVDEDVLLVFWLDEDGDGAGDPEAPVAACDQPEGAVDNDLDCDDADADSRPGLDERCDGRDNDCDGDIDEADATDAARWLADADGDGHGDPMTAEWSCDPPSGFVAAPEDPAELDCDDTTAAVSPSADERCNDRDDDCDGELDEDDAVDAPDWYIDYDGDGYGGTHDVRVQCEAPRWYVDNDLDCDDTDRLISPDAAELCDGSDNDCDGETDEDDAIDAVRWYRDGDGDGHGDPDDAVAACDAPSGYTATDDDCDDQEATTYAGADERCDGADNDCDGDTDEDDAIDAAAWYLDGDLDGYGRTDDVVAACSQPAGRVADASDCDDDDDAVNPGAAEVCNNGIDDDCDTTDNTCPLSGTTSLGAADASRSALLGGGGVALGDVDGDGFADLLLGSTDQDTAWVSYGPATGDRDVGGADAALTGDGGVGTAVAWVGDLDGDGYGELLVGAPDHDAAGPGAGVAWLLYGPTTGDRDLDSADATLWGVSDGDGAGAALSLAGDVNGDAIPDFIVGGAGGAAAWILHGPVSGPLGLGNANARLRGSDDFGAAVAGLGDVDGDGLDDVAVGGPSVDDTGSVAVFLGTTRGLVAAASADTVLTGAVTGDQAGAAVLGLGDQDGDGYDDFAIGAPGEAAGGADAGAIYLVFGPATASGTLTALSGATLSGAAGDRAGSALAAGDTDGDGHLDLTVGLPGDDSAGSDAGAAALFFGPLSGSVTLSAADARFEGDAGGVSSGSALASGADTDGDGYTDLLIASPGGGAASLILGGGL